MRNRPVRAEEQGGALRRYRDPQDGVTHVQIMQGDYYVTGQPDEVLSTILGSCIAACIRDPVLGIGGMNHFLLPEGTGEDAGAQRFGVNAMEMLINGILGRGGERGRLEAKLFGGANVIAALSNVGTRNAEFARHFLEDEGILIVGGDMGGTAPRRVQYWPASGRARRLAVRTDSRALVESEINDARAAAGRDDGVELF